MGGFTRAGDMDDVFFPFPPMTYHMSKDTDQKSLRSITRIPHIKSVRTRYYSFRHQLISDNYFRTGVT